jgi:hypothetical protein
MIECLQGEILGAHGRRHGPADDLPRARIGNKRGVAEPLPGPHEGDVGDPQPVRCRCTELAVDQIRGPSRGGVGDGGEHRLAALHATQAGLAHQPPGLFPAEYPAAPRHRRVHLLDPVDRVVLSVHGGQLGHQLFIADLPVRRRAGPRGPIASRGKEAGDSCPQHTADELDSELIAMSIDVGDHFVAGRSSSAAKNADADFRISLALRNSAFSRLSLRISACSELVTPGRSPASI